jgi:hypothetical protein
MCRNGFSLREPRARYAKTAQLFVRPPVFSLAAAARSGRLAVVDKIRTPI